MMNIESKRNKIRLTLLSSGIACLIFSYLCFINLIQIAPFETCGSACEYWWSWIINFPPQGICILICVPRNSLYKLLFLIGCFLISIEFLMELMLLTKEVILKKDT